jgi:Protein of unknown function (DUF3574)
MPRSMPILDSRPRLPLLLSLLLIAAGCATPKPSGTPDRPAAASSWTRTELYFGGIPAEEWQQFLAGVVTPKFPAGLTVLEAQGQWRARDGQVHSLPTRILVILHPGTRESNAALDDIRTEFKARFHHESVLRCDSAARVSF